MPEFQRGVALAYCDSPGPLDHGQKTFFAVSPIPSDWSDAQTSSFLREYNTRSIDDLTFHEAMPGHYVQLMHANRYDSPLRAVLASGTFIEGWAVYSERLMVEQGFRDGDPLMHLIQLKWYLRTIANAILDQAVHVDGMSREAAMRLMMHDTFQEEREASGKWVRAELTSAQLPTYFVGVQEHLALRDEARQRWGAQLHPEALPRCGALVRIASGAVRARADVRSADRMMVEAIRSGESGVVRQHQGERQQNAGAEAQIAPQAHVLIRQLRSDLAVLVEPEHAQPDDQQGQSALSSHHDRGGRNQRGRNRTENAHRPPGHPAGQGQPPVHPADESEHDGSIGDRNALRQLALRVVGQQADTQQAQRKGRNARIPCDLRRGGQASDGSVSVAHSSG